MQNISHIGVIACVLVGNLLWHVGFTTYAEIRATQQKTLENQGKLQGRIDGTRGELKAKLEELKKKLDELEKETP